MVFHAGQRFPTNISYGSSMGPKFNANVIRSGAGPPRVINRWPRPLREYDVSYGIRSKADAYAVIDFFIAREGPANGFLLKDWADFTTATDGTSAHSNTDVIIGVGDGTTTQFQLIKEYEPSTSYTKTRTIEKPVTGTVLVSLNTTNTTAFTFSTSTGVVNMNSAPGIGVVVRAGCEFDVPCQFGEEFSVDALLVTISDFDIANIPSIPIQEMAGETTTPERYYHGDGTFRTLAADEFYEWDHGLTVIYNPTVAGPKVLLPNTLDLSLGAPYHHFYNANGTNSILFRDYTDTSTFFTLLPTSGAVTLIFPLSGVKTWGAITP